MNNMSIKMKLVAAFTVLLCMMVGLGGYSLYSLTTVNQKTEEITQNWMVGVRVINDIMDNANIVRRYELNHLVAQSDQMMDQYAAKGKENKGIVLKKFEEYQGLINATNYATEAERAKDQQALDNLKKLWAAYDATSKQTVGLSRAHQKEAGEAIVIGKSLDDFAALNKELETLIGFNNAGANQASKESGEIYATARWATIVVLSIAVLLGVVITYFLIANIRRSILELMRVSEAFSKGNLRVETQVFSGDELGQLSTAYNQTIQNVRNLIRQIQNTAEQVAASSEELTASADQSAQVTQQIAQNIGSVSGESERQTAAVESTSAVVQQMSGGIEQAARNANTSADNAAHVVEKSKEGGAVIQKAVTQMGSIEATVNSSAEVVKTLGERSKEIGQIVETISGIAGQTNLLALNAAIEAARAGEMGKGFAVVAEEVRKLAEQSQEAAERIATLITTIQGETEKAVTAMSAGTQEVKIGSQVVNDAGAAFGQLADMAVDISQQVQDISATMREMSTGAEQIVSSVKDVDIASRNIATESQTVAAATEEQSAAMEQIAASSQNLAKLAQNLQAAAQKFEV